MENYQTLLDAAYLQVKPIEKELDRCDVQKIQGRFEGNKTIITNFAQIATCLRRDANHLAKFIFKELATPGEISGDRLILTRKVLVDKINEKINLYASKFVICPNCKKPDTQITEEGGQRYLRCLACGNKTKIVE
jgi:translation initiation factor 2 subunit 2